MTIGENIRLHRKEKGITQKKLAELVSLNEVTIRGYEAGKYTPKIENLRRISAVLGVPLEVLDENFRNIGNLLESVKLKNLLENIEKKYQDKDNEGMQEMRDTLRMTIQDLDIDIAEYQNILNAESDWFTTIKDIYNQLDHESKKTMRNIITDFRTLNEDGRIALIEQIELIKKIPDYKNTTAK